jgi:hypothetical protein
MNTLKINNNATIIYLGNATEQERQDNGTTLILKSYQTFVSEFNTKTRLLKINGFYSQTTLKHIKKFVGIINAHYETAFNNATKKDLEAYLTK